MQNTQPFNRNSLAALFEPKSVAIIGASDDPSKIGGRPVHLLKAAGFASPIYPVNPTRHSVQGLRSFNCIADVPEPPELAIIAVPARSVPSAFEEVVAAGAKAAIIYSSGFAELGDVGREVQKRLVDRARNSGCRVLGPNCLGVINTRTSLVATFSGGVGKSLRKGGSIGLASQSGALGAHCLVLAERRGFAFSQWATSGNEADIDVAELVAYMASDSDTKVIVTCLEGVRSVDRLTDAFSLARANGKQLVVMKVGASAVGAAAAASHTASMVGADRVFDAVLREYGLYRATSIEEMFDVAYGLSMHAPPRNGDLAVLTTSGGVGVLIADEAERLGLTIPELAESARMRIRGVLPFAGTRNPVDVTAQITNEPELLEPIFREMICATDCGSSITFLSHLGLRRDMMERLLPGLAAISRLRPNDARVACLLCDEATRAELEALGFSVFEDPTRAIRMISALVSIARATGKVARDLEALPPALTHELLAMGAKYNESECKRLIRASGVPTLPERVARSPEEAATFARSLGFPVALKIVSVDIPHKSDVGGVELSVQDTRAVHEAYAAIMSRVESACPHARVDGVSVSPMSSSGIDVIVGTLNDETFGPCVMVGMGGIFAEILDDSVIARAPLTAEDALVMIRRLKGAKMLYGARGTPVGDVGALAEAVAGLSMLAYVNRDRLMSLEVNPLRVLPAGEGVVALDALVTTRDCESALAGVVVADAGKG